MKNMILILATILIFFFTIALLISSAISKNASSNKNSIARYNYDGVYKNEYGAKWEITGDTAILSLDDIISGKDILLGSNIKNNVKYLSYQELDKSGTYTIELWYGVELLYKDGENPTLKFYKNKNFTLADLAKARLKNQMEYSEAINILETIDYKYKPIKDQSYKTFWEQTFEFTDKSIIKLYRKQENGTYILMPDQTTIK